MSEPLARWSVRTARPVVYDIVVTRELFAPHNAALLSLGRVKGGRRFIVIDHNVARYHVSAIREYFHHHGLQIHMVVFPGGEENKSPARLRQVLGELDGFPLHRRDEPILAIGGGVLTDVVAFAAACYRRGLPHIKVPTTLMGYVDAAVGVKCGVNFNGHKNRLGAFEPPGCVLLDPGFLRTLPRRHLRNGVCEILKLAVICDRELFTQLERHGAQSIEAHFQNPAGRLILDRAITRMLAELEPNLFEAELARKVDFGHTFSYGLEALAGHDLLHGEAVLLDILISASISAARGLFAPHELERVVALIRRLGLEPDTDALEVALLWNSLEERIEHRNGSQQVPVPTALGEGVFLNDVTRTEIETAVRFVRDRMGEPHALAAES